jgi:predicted nuclease of predicted toxin-antitoxin system
VRLLLDECCDPRLVAALRAAGHDVQHVLEADRGAADEVVLALSRAQGRILVTEDKDFGELAIRDRQPVPGLILLRFTPDRRHRKAGALLALLAGHGEQLAGRFAVVEESGVRLRPLLTIK